MTLQKGRDLVQRVSRGTVWRECHKLHRAVDLARMRHRGQVTSHGNVSAARGFRRLLTQVCSLSRFSPVEKEGN